MSTGFQRNQNPENEVFMWEGMAAAYTVFTKDRSLSVEAKKEAFHLLLNWQRRSPGFPLTVDSPPGICHL